MITAEPLASDKTDWRSECCKSPAIGELSIEWWEIKKGGNGNLTREGLCAGCNKLANFVKK